MKGVIIATVKSRNRRWKKKKEDRTIPVEVFRVAYESRKTVQGKGGFDVCHVVRVMFGRLLV